MLLLRMRITGKRPFLGVANLHVELWTHLTQDLPACLLLQIYTYRDVEEEIAYMAIL